MGPVVVHKCVRAYPHTHKCSYMHTYMHTYTKMYIRTFKSAYKQAFIFTYIHTYIHTYVRTSRLRHIRHSWRVFRCWERGLPCLSIWFHNSHFRGCSGDAGKGCGLVQSAWRGGGCAHCDCAGARAPSHPRDQRAWASHHACVCVCLYVCMSELWLICVYMCMHAYIHTYIQITHKEYIYIYIYIHMCVYIHMHENVHTLYAYFHVWIHEHIHTDTHTVHTYMHIHTCMHTYISIMDANCTLSICWPTWNRLRIKTPESRAWRGLYNGMITRHTNRHGLHAQVCCWRTASQTHSIWLQ